MAQWQYVIQDPSSSKFKKESLERASLQYEGWADSKKARIKAIDEELCSLAAKAERIGKSIGGGSKFKVGGPNHYLKPFV